jgi:hypothetical protein
MACKSRYRVTVEQKVLLRGRFNKDVLERKFEVCASTARQARNAVRRAGHTNITKVERL